MSGTNVKNALHVLWLKAVEIRLEVQTREVLPQRGHGLRPLISGGDRPASRGAPLGPAPPTPCS
jgi:hypothetical protein